MEKKEAMLVYVSKGLGEMEGARRATAISPSGQTRGLAGLSVVPDFEVPEKAVRVDPDISIITPSLNMLPYLRRCAASIIDQEEVNSEHIVVDGCSTDGTVQWLATKPAIRYISEKDQGMYDAINKGLRMARGEILAYLNCDEQYLPGILCDVKNYFQEHPGIDILFGGSLLIHPDGKLLAFRKAYPARRIYILTDHLYLLSCSTFWRRRILDHGIFFDPTFKTAGDAAFVALVLKEKFHAAFVKQYFAVFTMTGKNLCTEKCVDNEAEKLLILTPLWAQKLRLVMTIARRIEKFINGAYFNKWPQRYEIYMDKNLSNRKEFVSTSASFRWKAI
jgi:glycosyltransferase involved in cell wall biosynthesis